MSPGCVPTSERPLGDVRPNTFRIGILPSLETRFQKPREHSNAIFPLSNGINHNGPVQHIGQSLFSIWPGGGNDARLRRQRGEPITHTRLDRTRCPASRAWLRSQFYITNLNAGTAKRALPLAIEHGLNRSGITQSQQEPVMGPPQVRESSLQPPRTQRVARVT